MLHHSNFPYYCYQPNNGYLTHTPLPICRQFPTVDPSVFMKSAHEMEILMTNASTLLDKMAKDRAFSVQLMDAAQHSNKQKVEALIKQTGIKAPPEVTYTPSGLMLNFVATSEMNVKCCNLSMMLKWM